jgi:RimJ/RimL family protein N-acetyltransferase
MRRPEPVVLDGKRIRLEPLASHHLPDLQAAGDEDTSLFGYMASNPYLRGGWDAWLAEALEGQASGRYVCWAIIERASGKAIGLTRFGDIEPVHGRLEIGWTWLAASHQGTGANAEAKLLQLQHAFDVLGASRVAFRTDARNARSRRAS